MPDRLETTRKAAAGLRKLSAVADKTPVLIGFDGFVDSIIQVVDKRTSVDSYEPIPTIDRFGSRISAAAGKSSNFEMVTTLEKLGGNGPIMANALATAGVDVTYIGALGVPELHPVFEPLAQRAKVHSVANPGLTDCLEFNDGKLLMGKYQHLIDLDYPAVEQNIGAEAFKQIVSQSRLIGMVNWTMLTRLQTIWEKMADVILPSIGGERRLVFIDLCDPAKRTQSDLASALNVISRLDKNADVILGLNLSESTQVAEVLGVPVPGDAESAIETTAAGLREKLNIYSVVVHPRKSAAAAVRTKSGVQTGKFVGPFTSKPKLSTGAGDNFNAGFCLGQLAGLGVLESVCCGTHTSGFYVRNAHSPSLTQLADFLDHPPPAED
jgi:sugar/nucleoside kinase (ribokinase family)